MGTLPVQQVVSLRLPLCTLIGKVNGMGSGEPQRIGNPVITPKVHKSFFLLPDQHIDHGVVQG